MAFHPLTSLRVFGAAPDSEAMFTINLGVDKQEARQVTTRSLAMTFPRVKQKVQVSGGFTTAQAVQFSKDRLAKAVAFCDGTTNQKYLTAVHGLLPSMPKILSKLGLEDLTEREDHLTVVRSPETGLPVELYGVSNQRTFLQAVTGLLDEFSQDTILDPDEYIVRLQAASAPWKRQTGSDQEFNSTIQKWILLRENDNSRIMEAASRTTAKAIHETLANRKQENGLSATGYVLMKKAKGETTSLGEEDYWSLLDEDDAPNTEHPDTNPTA